MSMFIPMLKKKPEEADIAGLRLKQLCSLMYITSCSDEELKRRMIECNELTLQPLEKIMQRYKRVQADTSGTRVSAPAATVSGGKEKLCRQTNDSRGESNGIKLAALDGKCYRCGSTTQRAKE